MAKESKVQKVARTRTGRVKAPLKGACGHEIMWVLYFEQTGPSRMRQFCETCGAWDGREKTNVPVS